MSGTVSDGAEFVSFPELLSVYGGAALAAVTGADCFLLNSRIAARVGNADACETIVAGTNSAPVSAESIAGSRVQNVIRRVTSASYLAILRA